MLFTPDDSRIVLNHPPTMEAAETQNRADTEKMLARWPLAKLPTTLGEFRLALLAARQGGFAFGVRTCIQRVADLQRQEHQ